MLLVEAGQEWVFVRIGLCSVLLSAAWMGDGACGTAIDSAWLLSAAVQGKRGFAAQTGIYSNLIPSSQQGGRGARGKTQKV